MDLSLLNLIEGGVKEIPKGKLEPLGAVTLEEIAAKREHYEEIGLQAIYDCKVGAVLLAKADREQDLVWISQKEC